MSSIEQFEWTFSPSDYFEEEITVARDGYTLTIEVGKATATIDSVTYNADPSIFERIEQSLRDRLLAVQLLSHRPYDLSKSTRTRLHDDGQLDIYIECEPAVSRVIATVGSIVITDCDGNVIVDTKRDRLQKNRDLAQLISRHREADETVTGMLRSYDAAVQDPQNELVHLYEIRDALVARFGGKYDAIKALGIAEQDWQRLGQLCNIEPLRQGRHRGEMGTTLRDATEAELTEARSISRAFLEAYLLYLDKP